MTSDLTRRGVVAGGVALAALSAAPADAQARSLARIAFGSCAHQDKPQPIWDRVNSWSPELFIFLGDNVYGDTLDMNVLRAKYSKLADKPGFRRLRRSSQIIATWDDHDYGRDDAGREFPKKRESRDVFMDFWQEAAGSPRRTREGIYTSYMFGPVGRRVQVILPDNRWFRSGLIKLTEEQEKRGPYLVNSDREATMLGEAQWEWLRRSCASPPRSGSSPHQPRCWRTILVGRRGSTSRPIISVCSTSSTSPR
jgi:alkaline phosphatase D